jgi:hypothetical protein
MPTHPFISNRKSQIPCIVSLSLPRFICSLYPSHLNPCAFSSAHGDLSLWYTFISIFQSVRLLILPSVTQKINISHFLFQDPSLVEIWSYFIYVFTPNNALTQCLAVEKRILWSAKRTWQVIKALKAFDIVRLLEENCIGLCYNVFYTII